MPETLVCLAFQVKRVNTGLQERSAQQAHRVRVAHRELEELVEVQDRQDRQDLPHLQVNYSFQYRSGFINAKCPIKLLGLPGINGIPGETGPAGQNGIPGSPGVPGVG